MIGHTTESIGYSGQIQHILCECRAFGDIYCNVFVGTNLEYKFDESPDIHQKEDV